MVMLNLKIATSATAVFTALSYILCVLFWLVTPASLHMDAFLEAVLPGFEWISPGVFFLEPIESILWGVYLGGGFALLYNMFYRRWGTRKTA
jgi:hypothetical protein